jgi:transketolase
MHLPVMTETPSLAELQKIAVNCRKNILKMITKAKSGHPGGSLSLIDILVALFFTEIRMKPEDPAWEDRDRFILSKGHGVPALYAILAQKGILKEQELMTLRMTNSRLQGHPDRHLMPVVEASTGSLGQGLSIAQGIAMALKFQKKDARVFCVIGDGESQEGQIWETAMSAPKFKLNNLIVFLDHNKGQIDGRVEEVMDIHPLKEKWEAFRWAVQEIDGHDYTQLLGALAKAKKEESRPTMIIANTIKGKGISFMEGKIGWHGVAPTAEELERCLTELDAAGGRHD